MNIYESLKKFMQQAMAERKMDPASRTTQKHVVKSICLREPQKMVRKSPAMGHNSLKSRICIDKNSHLWAPMVPTCSTFGFWEIGN